MKIFQEVFGANRSGEPVYAFRLCNQKGMEVTILTMGGIIQSIRVPDRAGDLGEVTLGCDSVADYERSGAYFGAIVGRYANRIARGEFELNGERFQLACNDAPNHLHGGKVGFDHHLWRAEHHTSDNLCTLSLYYESEDGEEGYPGTLKVNVIYTLNNQNELGIEYQATTDAPTVVNLTNHAYFNLNGSEDCLSHQLQLHCSHFTPTDETSIPYGEIEPVINTPMDFTTMKPIGQDIGQDFVQLKQARGYDHNWVIWTERGSDHSLKPVALAEEAESGRTLEVLTTQPGVQLYTGNFLKGEPARGGLQYGMRAGFCLETQHFPDSPNRPEFPSTQLNPGDTYQEKTVFRFGLM
ncbi:aldose epimerase family protein [Endozoicomonas elysicola]|uniref:Aldose 1-epimerase n=1 Tax=Endozoicomonas elysicola TaxID=305900 RepID=A0A081K831_9GAMM|nr:aldose epimerase family protein [Endozoicomonas elysicola]KEI70307.1 aldose epimerase [Endozoicomonas elysicola]